jgi:hypothetical protein
VERGSVAWMAAPWIGSCLRHRNADMMARSSIKTPLDHEFKKLVDFSYDQIMEVPSSTKENSTKENSTQPFELGSSPESSEIWEYVPDLDSDLSEFQDKQKLLKEATEREKRLVEIEEYLSM